MQSFLKLVWLNVSCKCILPYLLWQMKSSSRGKFTMVLIATYFNCSNYVDLFPKMSSKVNLKHGNRIWKSDKKIDINKIAKFKVPFFQEPTIRNYILCTVKLTYWFQSLYSHIIKAFWSAILKQFISKVW